MDNSEFDADYDEAIYRNSVIEGRKKTFDHVIAQFEADDVEAVDAVFIAKALGDVCVRDAILHWLSNKYQIGLFGAETTLEDCSDRRKEFVAFLSYCGLEYAEKTEDYKESAIPTTITAIVLLDGEAELAGHLANQVCKIFEPTSLAKLIAVAVSHNGKETSKMFKSSVEETNIIDSLAGASFK